MRLYFHERAQLIQEFLVLEIDADVPDFAIQPDRAH